MPKLDPRLRRALGRLRAMALLLGRRLHARLPLGDASRVRAIRRALATGLFLRWYYEAQLGRTFESPRHAVGHYLQHGSRLGMLPHPLVDAEIAHDRRRGDALATAMAAGRVVSHRFSSGYDWDAYARSHPRAVGHPGGVAGHYASAESPQLGGPVLTDRGGEQVDWHAQHLVLRKHRAFARKILSSKLFDRAYYEAQQGVTFLSERAAVWHYLAHGEAAGLAPNPLFEPEWYRSRRKTKWVSLLHEYVVRNSQDVSPHPHFDPEAWIEAHPEAASHRGGPLGHFLATADERTVTVPFRDYAPMRRWHALRAEMFQLARDHAAQAATTRWGAGRRWSAAAATAEAARLDGLAAVVMDAQPVVSVIVDLVGAGDAVLDNIAKMLDQDYPALELVAITQAGDDLVASLDERVRVVTPPSVVYANRVNQAVRECNGDYVMIWDPRDAPRTSFVRRSLIGLKAARTSFVYSAIQQTGKLAPPVHGERYSRDGLLWGDHRAVSRTALLSRSLFWRAGGLDDQLPAHTVWDLVLRAAALVEPVLVRQIGLVSDLRAQKPVAQHSGYEQVARARQLCDWDDAPDRQPQRVSLLVPVYEDWRLTVPAVRAALDTTVGRDVEVVLVDNGSRPAVGRLVTSSFGHQPRVVYRRMPRNTNFSTGSNLAFHLSTGERVVFMNNDTEPEGEWLTPLLAPLDDETVRGVQPLLLYPDHTVQAAGTVFVGGAALPWHFMQGHPREDVARAGQTVFSAVTAAFMACRASDVQRVRGFDPVYANGMEDVDLCLTLSAELGGDFRVALDSVVVHKESQSTGRYDRADHNRAVFLRRWTRRLPSSDLATYEGAGLRAAYRPATVDRSKLFRTGSPLVVRPPRHVAEGPARGLPSLRWAIKSAARTGPRGDLWGDTFFADDLARALRRLGQEVVIDRRDAHVRRRSDHLDDVVVGLRGLTQVTPQPGATSVLWIISHPEMVTDQELASGFELVYAASVPWAASATERSGREVRSLLQATDVSRFRPGPPTDELASGALFVGRTRHVFRPIVRDALEIGADLTIFGDGWGEFIDTRHVRAEHLANEDLPAAYRSARVVLNDHWTDMAAHGFLSNRLFDAAASGARVVTDRVAGLAGQFGDLVQEYETPDDLRALLDPASTAWISDEERLTQAQAVAADHSFDARAVTLLADVLDTRGVDHQLRG